MVYHRILDERPPSGNQVAGTCFLAVLKVKRRRVDAAAKRTERESR
jgi:hypothetical protein